MLFFKRTAIFLLLVPALLAAGATERWRDYLQNDWQQARKPLSVNTLLYGSAWLATMYAASYADEDISSFTKRQYSGGFKTFLDYTNELGNARYSVPASIGITALSLLTSDARLQDACLTSTQSLLITGAITGAVKAAAGRFRPYKNEGPRKFRPFSGNHSFPSGHTSSAFAIVTPLALYYDTPLSYALFIFPVGTAVARIAKDRHWATDVLSGGLLGFLVGKTLTDWHQKREQKLSIAPGPVFTIFFTVN